MKCNHRTVISPHPSIRIGGIATDRCELDVLPGMVVCEYHATPEAVRMLVEDLYRKVVASDEGCKRRSVRAEKRKQKAR